MCGIAGIAGGALAGPADRRAQVQAMADCLAHRGPDGEGVWTDEANGVALAHRRLAIIDLSPTGAQPMRDTSGRYTIVYNGEIYNYRELRRELESRGVIFRGASDTEVLLELFAREGERCLTKLNGIFAFAIWDAVSRELFLARDALGVKPLYYSEQPSSFLFASELKALVPWLSRRTLDVSSLLRYVTFLWCPGDGTPLREVRKLGPGEAMVVREGRVVRRWTWYELPARRGVTPESWSKDEAVVQVQQALRRAVQRQLVADVPVGALLSGGIDSSAIVAFAREAVRDLRCFTIEPIGGQDVGFADDLPYARRVAQHLGVRLDVISVDAGRMAHDVAAMVAQLDEPLADPAPLNVRYISELARQHGIPVLLSGAGGDDLFTGYRRHLALSYESLWAWAPRPALRALAGGLALAPASRAWGRRLQGLARAMKSDSTARLIGYFEWLQEREAVTLFAPGLRKTLSPADAPLRDFLAGVPCSLSRLQRMLALEQRFFLADHNLAYTDRMSMAAGIEVRVPFLDLELVELAARIPDRFKQHGNAGKWVLKQAMTQYLPREVINRPKTGFGVPLRRWLRQELKPLADELLSAETIARRGLFDAQTVANLRARDAAGRIDATYPLFGMMAIELWCREFLDACRLSPLRSGSSKTTFLRPSECSGTVA